MNTARPRSRIQSDDATTRRVLRRMILTRSQARSLGLRVKLTTAITTAEAMAGAFDDVLTDQENARVAAALVLTSGTHHDGKVEVWRGGYRLYATPRERATHNSWQKARADERLAAGLCVYCAQPRGADGTSRCCRPCADRRNRYRQEYSAPTRSIPSPRTRQQTNANHA